jgi:hypothetical protein
MSNEQPIERCPECGDDARECDCEVCPLHGPYAPASPGRPKGLYYCRPCADEAADG